MSRRREVPNGPWEGDVSHVHATASVADVQRDAASGQLLNSQSKAVTIFFVCFAIFGLAIAVALRQRPLAVVAGLGLFALCVVFAVRTSKSAITWDSRGILTRDIGRTKRLAWSSIEGFDHSEGLGLGARLTSGRRVRLLPFPRNRTNDPEAAVAKL
jgi:hypothetical protein